MIGADTAPPRRLVAVCAPCRLAVVLGTLHTGTAGTAGTVIDHGDRAAWRHTAASRALWRFVIEHTGHRIEVVTEGALHFADGSTIPGNLILVEPVGVDRIPGIGDLTTSHYAHGWPVQPRYRHVSGPPRCTFLHPQPERHPHEHCESTRPTIRPGIPIAPHKNLPLVVPWWTRPVWFDYVLRVDHQPNRRWTLCTVGAKGGLIEVARTSDLDTGQAAQAQLWASQIFEVGHADLRTAHVTAWRPVMYSIGAGWVPLFDTSDRAGLPWNDLSPATGHRHQANTRTTAKTEAGYAGGQR